MPTYGAPSTTPTLKRVELPLIKDRKNPPLAKKPMASTKPAMAAKLTANMRACRSSLVIGQPSDNPYGFARAFKAVEDVSDLFAAMFGAQ